MALQKLGVKIKSGLKSLIYNPKLYLYRISKLFLASFVMLFALLTIPLLLGNDYAAILSVAEFAIVGSGTLAILTFTYALVKDKTETRNEHDKIVRSGEFLFQCTVTLVMGLGLLPQVGFLLKNHANISSSFGVFAAFYDGFLTLISIVIMVVGMFSLIFSALFLVLGITELIELFETNLQQAPADVSKSGQSTEASSTS